MLRALVSSPEDSDSLFVPEVTAHPPWLSKAHTPVTTPRPGHLSSGQLDPLSELHSLTKRTLDSPVSDLHVQQLAPRPTEALIPSPSMNTHGSPSYPLFEEADWPLPPPPPPGFNIFAVVPDISRVVDMPLPMDETLSTPDQPSQTTSPRASASSSFPQLTEGSFHLRLDSSLSSSVKCLTQMDPGSDSRSSSPVAPIIDLTHSSGDSAPSQLPVPPRDKTKAIPSAALLLSTAFSALPQTSPTTRPRSGSLESDQLIAIQKAISAGDPLLVAHPVSKSVPPSPDPKRNIWFPSLMTRTKDPKRNIRFPSLMTRTKLFQDPLPNQTLQPP